MYSYAYPQSPTHPQGLESFQIQYPYCVGDAGVESYRTGALSDYAMAFPPYGMYKAYQAATASPDSGSTGSNVRSPGGRGRHGSDDTDWSGVAKIALVVGGAATLYLIYRASQGASKVSERLGAAGVGMLAARSGGGSPRSNRSNRRLLPA